MSALTCPVVLGFHALLVSSLEAPPKTDDLLEVVRETVEDFPDLSALERLSGIATSRRVSFALSYGLDRVFRGLDAYPTLEAISASEEDFSVQITQALAKLVGDVLLDKTLYQMTHFRGGSEQVAQAYRDKTLQRIKNCQQLISVTYYFVFQGVDRVGEIGEALFDVLEGWSTTDELVGEFRQLVEVGRP